jgi:hypothetical protein
MGVSGVDISGANLVCVPLGLSYSVCCDDQQQCLENRQAQVPINMIVPHNVILRRRAALTGMLDASSTARTPPLASMLWMLSWPIW